MKKRIGFTILVLLFAACTPTTPGTGGGVSTVIVITPQQSTVVPETPESLPTEGPSPTPVAATLIPTLPTSSLSITELKYSVLEQYPNFFFCDPDLYPVAQANELTLAKERFASLQSSEEEFELILSRNNLSNSVFLTDQQKLLIYREHKKLDAISFQRVEDAYQFQIQTGREGQPGSLITGTIDANGSIVVQEQESIFPSCPICLAEGTLIDTPRGSIAVEELQVGDPVWTLNAAGDRMLGRVLRLGSAAVPKTHEILHVVLSDGRELWVSPGHPTADGQRISDVKLHGLLDGAHVVLLERLPYSGHKTYDLLPSGDTGLYWANGILLGSTLMAQP